MRPGAVGLTAEVRSLLELAFREGFANGAIATAEAASLDDPDGYVAKTFAQAMADIASASDTPGK